MDFRSIGSAFPTTGKVAARQRHLEYRGCYCGDILDNTDVY